MRDHAVGTWVPARGRRGSCTRERDGVERRRERPEPEEHAVEEEVDGRRARRAARGRRTARSGRERGRLPVEGQEEEQHPLVEVLRSSSRPCGASRSTRAPRLRDLRVVSTGFHRKNRTTSSHAPTTESASSRARSKPWRRRRRSYRRRGPTRWAHQSVPPDERQPGEGAERVRLRRRRAARRAGGTKRGVPGREPSAAWPTYGLATRIDEIPEQPAPSAKVRFGVSRLRRWAPRGVERGTR